MSEEILMTHIQQSEKNEVLDQKDYEDPLAHMTIEEIELNTMKEKATRCKVIALESLGHHPLANPTEMGRRDKKKVLDVMTLWFNTKSIEQIETEFNDIIDDKVLGTGKDFTNYGIKNNNIHHPRLPDDMTVCDVGGNMIDCTDFNKEIDAINTDLDTKNKVYSS